MNNMKYYTNNFAYDYDMFLPKDKRGEAVPKKPENIINLPVVSGKAGAKREQKEKFRKNLFTFTALFMICAAIALSMFMRAKATELNTEINAATKELSKLQSEEIRLEMELERRISFSNIEKAAQELGMHKKEKAQINYIRIGGDSHTEVIDNSSRVFMAEKENGQ